MTLHAVRAGIVSPTTGSSWLGGLYIVQALVQAASLLPPDERPLFRDVWWDAAPSDDPWKDIRPLLEPPAVVHLPRTLMARAARALRRPNGLGDLFRRAGVDVLFPVRVVDEPGIPFVFHLADFQHRYLEDINDQRVFDYFESLVREESSRATLIHVTSQAVLRDVERFAPELLPKARAVFPVSIPSPVWFARDPREVAVRLGLPERFFVIPNMVAAHKNHITIARALAEVPEAHVVCTGKTADYRHPEFFAALTADIASLGVTSRMHFLGVVDRADQMALLRRAVAVIQPSRFEGWGAAVAEAKALGKSLLCSDLPVHREHAPDDVRWIEPLDAAAWAAAMRDALNTREPGPSLEAEAVAAARIQREAREVGRGFVAMLREAAGR